ncbi:unnamed protein product [Cuscuta epithymum]|uniref:EF-hand domain-containing protein n=1 Tax=Cuscuta epithymum TaxID=186058 RepID=A0AAV0CUD0_9ASTE|nr:unnamed protein product [Cuscuta epithymum]
MAGNANLNSRSTVYLQDAKEVESVFKKFDANGDGKISAEELSGVMKDLGSSISSEELKQMMDDIDTDKDGFINLQEFADFCKGDGDGDGGLKDLREAFDFYDADKDGLISVAELKSILSRLGMGCSAEDCSNMIRSVDSDEDGSVNFAEFKQMMTNKQ